MAGRFQFSIRTCLLTTALIGAALAVLTAEEIWPAGLGLFLLCPGFPAFIAVGLFHTTGYPRAFLVGALFPACAGLMVLMSEIYGAAWSDGSLSGEQNVYGFLELIAHFDARLAAGFCWLTMPFTGMLGMAAEWAFKDRRNPPA